MAKILVVGKFYPPCRGGTEFNTLDICEALAKQHDVTALVFNHEPGLRVDMQGGVRVIRCNVTCMIESQPMSLQYWYRLKLQDFDIVHFHAPNLFANAALLIQLQIKGNNVPVVISHHSEVHGRRLLRAILIPLYRHLARKARYVVVTSLKNAHISADLPTDAKLAVVPLGVEPDDYTISPAVQAEATNWRNSICGSAPTIVFIGRHARYKGLDVLIRALALISHAHALIAGNGPFRKAAEALSISLGVQDRTHFLGDIGDAEKLRLLAAADVFAFPSTEVTEAFGISQLEAMAAGVAVVASNLPTGVTDVAIHNETALLVSPNDADGLAAALQRILNEDGLQQRLAERGRAAVHLNFSKRASMLKFCALINKCLD